MTLKTQQSDLHYEQEQTEITPERASELYVKFEEEINLYRARMANAKRKQKDLYRKKIKKLKEEQNLLFPIMKGTGFVEITQRLLGLEGKRQGLYKRYMYNLNKNKKDL